MADPRTWLGPIYDDPEVLRSPELQYSGNPFAPAPEAPREYKHEAKPYAPPGPPRWEREVAEGISPTMGAYGLAGLATTAAMDASHAKYDPATLGPLAAAIFAGPRAKTADMGALAKAQEMTARGTDRREVLNHTGWFQGADKKWRFEVPDNTSRWSEPAEGGMLGKLPKYLEHPALYEAYPELREAMVLGSGNKGGAMSGSMAGHDALIEMGRVSDPRSMALHEIQHAIQKEEGFAKGANPWELKGAPDMNNKDIHFLTQGMEELRQQLNSLPPGSPAWASTYKLQQQMGENLAKQQGYEAYRRHAGEVEARNVQARQHMPDERRRNTAPWEMEDVRPADQIVRFDEPKIMAAAKAMLEREYGGQKNPEIAKQIEDYRQEGVFLRDKDAVREDVMPLAKFNGKDIRASQQTVDAKGLRYWKKQIAEGARPAILLQSAPNGYRIVDGHTRATAYRDLGIEDVPVLIRERQ